MTPGEAHKLAALVSEWSLDAGAWPLEENLPGVLMDPDASRRALARCALQLREVLAQSLHDSDLAELFKNPVLEPLEQDSEGPGG